VPDSRTGNREVIWSGLSNVPNTLCLYQIIAIGPCPSLTAPGNGTISCFSSDDEINYVGDICTYTCDSGFVLSDTDNRECQNDGRWSGTEPFCDQGKVYTYHSTMAFILSMYSALCNSQEEQRPCNLWC